MQDTPRRIPAYEALALDLRERGIDMVFGLMSDDTALFVTTLDAVGVRFRAARHENSAIAMAEGYAAATGRIGVAIIGRGPAMANALHGAVYAQRTGSRVLLIFGASSAESPAPGRGVSGDPKAFRAGAVLEAAGFTTYVPATAQTARATLAAAIDATAQGGCAALLLPIDVQSGLVDASPGAFAGAPRSNPAPLEPRAASIELAGTVLARSRRPLFVVGQGAHRAGAREEIAQLARHTGALVATTLKAKDMFRGLPFDLGIVGSFSHSAARRLIEKADCVVAFGAGLNNRTTSDGTSLPLDVPLVQVDISSAHVARWYHADVEVIGDARRVAQRLLEAVPERAPQDKPFHEPATLEALARFDRASDFKPAPTARTMDPKSLAIALDRVLPPERNAVFDAGNFLQVAPFIGVPGPGHWKNTADFASIGMGFGTALGFACGTPGRPTVLFIGDGAFLMTLGELETVVREDIPLVIVVMNDCAYGAELHFLKMRGMATGMAVFPDVDFAPMAEPLGFEAHTVRTLAELEALAPVLRNPQGPILLDCKINASVAAGFLSEAAGYNDRPA